MRRAILVLLSLLPLNLYAQGAGTPPFRGSATWNLIWPSDNTFDIGASGATRPRTGYFGTSVITPALTVSGLTSGRVPVASTGGSFVDFSTFTFSGGTVTATNLVATSGVTAASVTDSGLTATRVPFASTGGLLADDADMTFATDTLTVTKLIAGAGTCAAPGVRVGTDTDTGLIEPGAGSLDVCTNNSARFRFGSGGLFSATSGVTLGSSLAAPDLGLFRIASGVLKVSNSAAGTVAVGFVGGGANVASATALPAPVANVYHVTGTTTITSITSTNIGTGTCIVLIFDGILTLTDGSNLKMAGDFVTSADDTWTGCFDGTNWFETGRTVN